MHDFSCRNPDGTYYQPLAEQVRYYKEDAKGVAAMCKIVEDLIEDFIDIEKKEIVLRMLRGGELSLERIAEYAGLTLEQVQELAKVHTA